MSTFVKLALLALCGYAVIVMAAWYFRNSLIFHPSHLLAATPGSLHLAYEDARIKTADGVTIHGWYVPASGGPLFSRDMTVLFFHGNAGNISGRLDYIRIFNDLGLNSLMVDYHGYGQSGGKPSVQGSELDAMAAWNWLVEEKGVPPHKIVLHGHSLGGGVAGWLAGRVKPAAIILEGTFTSLGDAGGAAYPFLPVKLFIGGIYDTRQTLRGRNLPALFIHSPEDDIVPYALGRELYEFYDGPKQFLQITGSHSGGFLQSGRVYIDGVKSFLLNLK